MRVFQNVFVYPSYISDLERRLNGSSDFRTRHYMFVRDRYCAVHFLQPDHELDGDVFLTANSYPMLQRAWAIENGLRRGTPLKDIMLAQIEAHRSDVFYTQDPAQYGPQFLRKLPGCVRKRVCWQSPPGCAGDLSVYDLVLNNFPSSLKTYAMQGVRTAYFTPAYDPAMQPFGENVDRPIDVAFAGGYSRHHRRRACILEAVARLADRFKIVFALDRSRLTRLAESPIRHLLPLARHRRPVEVCRVTSESVFGIGMYKLFSKAKIVLNCAVDSAGFDRGNMRCFEAMGCGALMITDAGDYPTGMVDRETMRVYQDAQDACALIEALLEDNNERQALASKGFDALRSHYSKYDQWEKFVALVSNS